MFTMTGLISICLIGGSRLCVRIYHSHLSSGKEKQKRTLMIGVNQGSVTFAKQLLSKQESTLYPVAFIDHNQRNRNLSVYNIPIIGSVSEIEEVIENYHIEYIVIFLPPTNNIREEIYQTCIKTGLPTKVIPQLEELIDQRKQEGTTIQIEKLLNRRPVTLDSEAVLTSMEGKTVLITGAGGSIGSEITRQIMIYQPKAVILLGHGENSIYKIELELKETYPHTLTQIYTVIADIKDKRRLEEITETYMPNIIYHAAAHKHVPLMEKNPHAAVKNNVIGTMNVREVAQIYHVQTCVMVSTDKAVQPTSVMGATKRLAEVIMQEVDEKSETTFSVVRFGNVLGSRGSIIPLFKRQIERGGPVTITHPDMVRYFMTIPEASSLVIQAGLLAKGGETFVLDMGEPVKIIDLAKNLIRYLGCSVDEIGLDYTGIRPGEKLREKLLYTDEMTDEQIYPKIHVGHSIPIDMLDIKHFLSIYEQENKEELRDLLLEITGQSKSEEQVAMV